MQLLFFADVLWLSDPSWKISTGLGRAFPLNSAVMISLARNSCFLWVSVLFRTTFPVVMRHVGTEKAMVFVTCSEGQEYGGLHVSCSFLSWRKSISWLLVILHQKMFPFKGNVSLCSEVATEDPLCQSRWFLFPFQRNASLLKLTYWACLV